MKCMLLLLWIALQSPVELAILSLSGASCMEELSADEIERFERLAQNPLKLNSASRRTLEASGLLNPFQIASLLEYREESGDILSWTELSLVDGFSAGLTVHLRHFCVLDSHLSGAETALKPSRTRGSVESGVNVKPGSFSGRLRAQIELPWGVELLWNTIPKFSEGSYELGQISASYSSGGLLSNIIVGNFNARIGQGLVSWSGFSLSSFSSIQALSRRGTGFTASMSSSSLCGTAVTLCFPEKYEALIGLSLSGEKKLLGSVRRNSRRLSTGLNFSIDAENMFHAGGKASALQWSASSDWRLSLRSASFFGEGLFDSAKGLAGVCGISCKPSYGYELALLLRAYGRNFGSRSLVALATQWPWGFVSVECGSDADVEHRLRCFTKLEKEFSQRKFLIKPAARGVVRWDFIPTQSGSMAESSLRSELRLELNLGYGCWRLCPRFDAVWTDGFSSLGLVEAGREGEKLSVFLTYGIFDILDWNSRVYVYQRGVPGSFNLKAFRGRGDFQSAYLRYRTGSHSFYLCFSSERYALDPSEVPESGFKGAVMWKFRF